jgi:hypothetical protein
MTKKTTFLLALVLMWGLVSAQTKTKGGLTLGKAAKGIAYGNYKSPKSVTKVFAYDNHVIGSGLGSSEAHQMGMCIGLPSAGLTGYVGQKIDYVRFGIADKSKITAISVEIIEGSITAEPVYTETIAVSSVINGWNLKKLTTAYEIPAGKDVFIAVQVTNSAGAYSLALDTDAANHPENSGFVFLDNEYLATLAKLPNGQSIDLDFCLEAFITDGQGAQLSDLTITNIGFTTDNCTLSSTEVVKVTLKNAGEETINEKFNLSVDIDGTSLIQSVSPTAFVSGAEMVVDMPATDMSAYKRYELTATFDLNDDLSNNNNFTTFRSTGDATIQVDILTDAFPEETYWDIVDAEGNTWATNSTYEAETHYVENNCVASTGCYVFRILDAYGDGIAGYNSPAGTFTIRYNGTTKAICPTGGNFGSEFYAYGIGSGCPENDIILTSIDMPKYVKPGEQEIKGTIFNYGTENLTSFEVTYTIGDYTSPIYAVDGINIKTGETYSFTHDIAYNFDKLGEVNVELIVGSPNGVEDNSPDNNTKTKNIIVSNMQAKKQLFEHFTSSTCDPCGSYTPTADALLANNADRYSLIRYQVNWPGNGDPYYTSEVSERVSFYDEIYAPSVYRNGTREMSVEQDVFENYADQVTPITIGINAVYHTDKTVDVQATIGSLSAIPAGLTAHIAVVEKKTTKNASTNGETEFHNVLMKMLPDADGTTLDALSANVPVVITESYNMSTTNVEEISDLRVVVFVQDDETKEVMQSDMVDVLPYTNVAENEMSLVEVYPNPFNQTLYLNNLQQVSKVTVTNVLGQKVAGYVVTEDKLSVSTQGMANGVYFVTLTDNKNNQRIVKVVKQ